MPQASRPWELSVLVGACVGTCGMWVSPDVASQLKRNRKLEDTRDPTREPKRQGGRTRGTRFLVSRVRPLRVLLSLAGSYYYAVSLHNKIHSTVLFVKSQQLLVKWRGTRWAKSDAASLLFVNAVARAVEVVGLGCGVEVGGGGAYHRQERLQLLLDGGSDERLKLAALPLLLLVASPLLKLVLAGRRCR